MKPRWFVRGDVDGFFGLFTDNLLQLMLVLILCTGVCGIPAGFVTARILPGAALSILVGNLFYAWQARRLMRETGRDDVTALPYGINTPSLFAYVLFVMGPVHAKALQAGAAPEAAWRLAWQAGLFATLGSGVMETAGAFVGGWLRRHTPRAALLSALAGIAITFISMEFVFRIFANPWIGLLPAMVILVAYASRSKSILGLPGGLLAILVGVALAWGFRGAAWLSGELGWAFPFPGALFKPWEGDYRAALHLPVASPGDLFALLGSEAGWGYLAVIFPMGLFNVIGSIQNLESAEAAGDRFETRPSLLANGIGSLAAGLFGSPFPTTIYIGHPAWKAMGARAGYSIANGVAITALCLAGGMTLVLKVVPIEAAAGILLWIGILIAAQAFQEVPKSHALAVALGLVPALAAWGLEILVKPALRAAGATLASAAEGLRGPPVFLDGLLALSQGALLSSMALAAILAHVADREFRKASLWCAAAAALSAVGLVHAYHLTPAGVVENRFWIPFLAGGPLPAAPGFAAMYAASAAVLWMLHVAQRRASREDVPRGV